jgi:hypothetical protein
MSSNALNFSPQLWILSLEAHFAGAWDMKGGLKESGKIFSAVY